MSKVVSLSNFAITTHLMVNEYVTNFVRSNFKQLVFLGVTVANFYTVIQPYQSVFIPTL